MDTVKLEEILDLHAKWLRGENGGVRAELQGASLRGANLQGANLQDANLQDVSLRGANLQGASLRGANLQDASLQRADLRYANLQDANLQRADLQRANLDYSCWPLHCGSKGVSVDLEFTKQLAMHISWLICDDPKFIEFKKICEEYSENADVKRRHNL
jgi:uncharacterized protein YjbI with pentapeptide repeats